MRTFGQQRPDTSIWSARQVFSHFRDSGADWTSGERTNTSKGNFPNETHIPGRNGTIRFIVTKEGGGGSVVRRGGVGRGRHNESGVKVEGGGGELVELCGSQVVRNDGQLGEERSNAQH